MTAQDYINPMIIIQELHSTLELKEILTIFCRHLTATIKYIGFNYHNPDYQQNITIGKQSDHVYQFNLSVDEFSLGTIRVYKKDDFTENELEQLEEALCYLIQPLRNALTHYQAVNAAIKDPLTQLLNRSTLNATLQRETGLAERKQRSLSLLILDIDGFKGINDQYGHQIGDKALVSLADLIKQTIRDTDIAFRIGGEEFLIILSDPKPSGATRLAERLRQHVETTRLMIEGSRSLQFTISIGLADYQQDENPNDLISRADKALYKAKSSGKNKVVIAS